MLVLQTTCLHRLFATKRKTRCVGSLAAKGLIGTGGRSPNRG
jgi:hypothetical protein